MVSEGELRCDLWGFHDGAFRRQRVGKEEAIVPFKPNRVRVGDILDGLRAAANVTETIAPPAFLDAPGMDAGNYLALRNGVLDVASGALLPHSPRFFNLWAADYDFDPGAEAPAWEKFLDDLFDDDLESRSTLEEVLDLFLVPVTKYQKLFLIVGPRRAGKGVIGRLVPKLIGSRAVTTPMIETLGESFGLANLVGKSVAVIGDVRLKANAEEVAGSLLMISGEDGVTVNRKHKKQEDMTLRVRFLMLSNELPHLNDPSGAFSSRFVVLQLRESFLGREDNDLDEKLAAECPGILNRSLADLRRLRERGRFIQSSAGSDAIEALETLASPHKVFLRERCEEGPNFSVDCSRLYEAWVDWCKENGRSFP